MEQVRTHNGEVTEADLAAVARDRARAEFAEWSALLRFARGAENAIAPDAHPFMREAELSVTVLSAAQALGLSEMQASARLAVADRVRENTPQVWLAFRDGRIDAARVREIDHAIIKLERAESILRLDARVVAYAESHTVAELRRWLKLFVARVEADLAAERAEAERAARRVEVLHGEDGMSCLSLYGPSLYIAAVDNRMTKEAKAFGDDDPRTLDQRRADLMLAWLTTNNAREAAIHADIAITIPANALAGGTNDPAVAYDGSWFAPPEWVADIAKYGDAWWHRVVLDPVTSDVLTHEYLGRFAPDVLTKAMAFRDGTCQAPGCLKPALLCDQDHRVPHEVGGPTVGTNMGPLCRRHHKAKGHGLLTWSWEERTPGRPVEPPPRSVPTDAMSLQENRLATVIVQFAA